jgi:hypothetical protein
MLIADDMLCQYGSDRSGAGLDHEENRGFFWIFANFCRLQPVAQQPVAQS